MNNVSLRAWGKIVTGNVGKNFCELNKYIRSGNIKVPSSTCIFNFSSATDCSSRKLGICAANLCGVKCYAIKSEYKNRPDVLPFRRKQEAYWKKVSANEFVSDFLLVNALKETPYTKLRFSEAGDFHNQDCVNKAEKIASLLSRFGIKCYCYTSRKDLDFSKCKNLIISGSGFMKDGVSNIFKIIKNKKDKPKGYGICKGNCKVCDWCSIRGKKVCVMAH